MKTKDERNTVTVHIKTSKNQQFTIEMGLLGREGLISSRSISASPNDDVIDTPDGETPGDKPENVERGDDGGEGGVSPLFIVGMSSDELLSC